MTLSRLYSSFFARPKVVSASTLYVFQSEYSAEEWIECMYHGKNSHAYDLVATIRSDMMMEYTFQARWCNAEVEQFYAVEPDVIVAVVKAREDE